MGLHGVIAGPDTAFNVNAVSLVFIARLDRHPDETEFNDFRGMIGSVIIEPGYNLILEEDSRSVVLSVVSGGTRRVLNSNLPFDDLIGTPHSYVGTWDDGLARIYLDGGLVAEEQFPSGTIDNLEVGNERVGISQLTDPDASRHWPGKVSEGLFYPYALSPAEVQGLHEATGLPGLVHLSAHSIEVSHHPLVLEGGAEVVLGAHRIEVTHHPLVLEGASEVVLAAHTIQVAHRALILETADQLTLSAHTVEVTHRPLVLEGSPGEVVLAGHTVQVTHHSLILAGPPPVHIVEPGIVDIEPSSANVEMDDSTFVVSVGA